MKSAFWLLSLAAAVLIAVTISETRKLGVAQQELEKSTAVRDQVGRERAQPGPRVPHAAHVVAAIDLGDAIDRDPGLLERARQFVHAARG